MSVLDILHWPDPRLQEICPDVEEITPEIEDLAQNMLETMYSAPGRGLAAPQVGHLLRLFVMDATWKDGVRAPVVMINPVLEETSASETERSEGCLSIPGVLAEISRPSSVSMSWTDLGGAGQHALFDGFAAACVQHELDHLNGLVTLDRLTEEERARVLTSYSAVTA